MKQYPEPRRCSNYHKTVAPNGDVITHECPHCSKGATRRMFDYLLRAAHEYGREHYGERPKALYVHPATQALVVHAAQEYDALARMVPLDPNMQPQAFGLSVWLVDDLDFVLPVVGPEALESSTMQIGDRLWKGEPAS